MTPAEFKTLREFLGLSRSWLAARLGVSLVALLSWESDTAVPSRVEAFLLAIEEQIEQNVSAMLDSIAKLKAQPGAESMVISLLRYRDDGDLWRYREDMHPLPASCHAAMLSMLRRGLRGMQVRNRIIYMSPMAYTAWLAGRVDSEEMRSAWAAQVEVPSSEDPS
ncbi:MAG: hypothetical protein LBK01_02595 [Burkholderiaceae bacterium]|jgi:transcriptional regulator with XRE-family HTH domain|nr:hypothetical protein [Burkholderiaceae bacterium]